MKFIWVIFLFLVGFSYVTYAQPFDVSTFLDTSFSENGTLLPELQGQLTYASQQFQALPDPVKAIFGNQRVEVKLTRNDGVAETLGVEMVNNQIISFTRHAPANPTMTIATDETTAISIAQSENISNAFIQAVNSGKLSYTAVEGGGGEFAVFVTNIMTWIMIVINAFLQFFGLS